MSAMSAKRLIPLLFVLAVSTTAGAADEPPRWQLRTSGSLQYDALRLDADEGENLDHDGFRRQRAAVSLAHRSGFELKLDYDFAAGAWADALVRFSLGAAGAIRVGQFKTPMGLDVLTSHRNLNLFERSPATSVLLLGRRLGVEWSRPYEGGTVTVAAIGDNIDRNGRGHGLFARGTRQIGSEPDGHRLHLGLSGGVEWPHGPVRFRPRPDVSGLPVLLADSGVLADADRIERLGAEFAWDRGPFNLQVEHVELRGDNGGEDIDGRGGYLALGWRLTGEARGYRNGVFENPQPARAWGAFELAGRFSRVEVPTAVAGEESGRSFSLGVNWYLGKHWKLMAQGTAARNADGDRDRIYGLRAHFFF